MEFDRDYEQDYDALKTLLLKMAQKHAVAPLLNVIVPTRPTPHVALARIWPIQEGDCPCPAHESTCDDNAGCLHL